jgi:drug/metabolite transporter (DMT)-like permease
VVEPRPALGYAMVAIAATLFAVNGTVSKVVLGSGISSGQLTEIRCAGALVGFALIAAATRPQSLRLRHWELPLVAGLGVALALVQWSYFFAIHRLDIGIALLIQYVAPILVALWARFVFHERVRQRIWIALALSLSGLTLIVEIWHGGELSGPGVAACILAAVTYAAYVLIAEQGVRRRDPISLSPRGASSSPRSSGRSQRPGGTSRPAGSTTASPCWATCLRASCPSGCSCSGSWCSARSCPSH